ncbi:hypothetical protein BJV78DRAFT_695808 [Lactifluus subvellereus]|nr:hypothetical protein BJV78DRAFT_695808 [Lactifluus subvellereus]
MAYVLVPPLPPGMRKSDYQPLGQRLPTRSRPGPKGKTRVGDNSGTRELASALQGAFENNSLGAGNARISPTRRRKGKRKAVDPVEVVEVVDDEDRREGAEKRTKGSTNLALALTKAFAHNSANPKVAAPTLAGPVASGSTRRFRRSAPVMTLSDSASVEVVLPPPTKRTRPSANVQVISDADTNDPPTSTRVSPRRKGKGQSRMSTSPQKKRQRTAPRGGDSDQHETEDDDEIEIIVDAPRQLRRATRGKPHDEHHLPQPSPKSPRDTRRHRTSAPSPMPISISTLSSSSPPPSLPPQSAPATPPNVNTLAGLPLTILPPTPAEIVIPSRALSHLHAPPGPPDPGIGAKAGGGEGTSDAETQTTTQDGPLQGFRHEEAAEGAHGLLTSPTAAATAMATVTTTTGSSPRAPTTDPQHTILDLGDIVVPMDIDDRAQEQVRHRQDADQAADIALALPPHALPTSSAAHLDDPILGFVPSEHEDAGRAGTAANTGESYLGIGIQSRANMGADLQFMLATLNASPGPSPGWIDWGTGVVSGAATANAGTGGVATGEFAGDGTIDPSVLGGGAGAGSPGKLFRSDSDHSIALDDRLSSPGRFPRSRAVGEDEHMDDLGDEEDVMGLLFQDPTDGDFVPPTSVASGVGKGKGKAVAGTEHAGARGVRRRRKSWRKALADNNDAVAAEDHDDNDDEDQENEGTPSVSPSFPPPQVSELSFCHHCRERRTDRRCVVRRSGRRRVSRAASYTAIFASRSGAFLCSNSFPLLILDFGLADCRYPDLTFDASATVFACPCCGNFCNCSHCARARGEQYISERNGGWRKWGRWPAPAAAATGHQHRCHQRNSEEARGRV